MFTMPDTSDDSSNISNSSMAPDDDFHFSSSERPAQNKQQQNVVPGIWIMMGQESKLLYCGRYFKG